MRPSKEEEEALAHYFEENRDNPAVWNAKPTKIRIRRGGASAVFSVRFTPEELQILQANAAGRGITISKLIRDAALREAAASPAGPAGLMEVAESLHQIAELISTHVESPSTDMDERLARSFVPGKLYTNVPRPKEAPPLVRKMPRGSRPAEPEQSVQPGRRALPKKA